MTLLRGITLLDLIDELPPGSRGFIPADVSGFFELLSIVEHRAFVSGQHYIHYGLIQSATDAGLSLPRGFPLEIPGLNTGIKFQFSSTRVAASGDQNLEPEPSHWQLDLFLDRLAIPIPGLKPATRVPSAPTQPAHLVPDTTRTRVKFYGKGVLRIEGGDDGTNVRLIGAPDPFNPDAPIGTVLTLGLTPPHVMFMDNGFGMTLGEVVIDAAEEYTPTEIVARGHGPEWEGFGISEAAVYLPRDLPAVGDFSLGVRDMLIGTSDPGGVQLEAWLEFGDSTTVAGNIQFFQEIEDSIHSPSTPSGPATTRTVTLHGSTPETARVRARMGTGLGALWKKPGLTWERGTDTGWFSVRVGNNEDTLKFKELSTGEDGQEVEGQEIVFQFERGTTTFTHAPKISVTIGANTWANVTHIGGTRDVIGAPTFTAVQVPALNAEQNSNLSWELRHDGNTISGQGETFTPNVTWQPGEHLLELEDQDNHKRHLMVQVLEEGHLVIGNHGGPREVVSATESAATPTQVVASHSLSTFHGDGTRNSRGPTASLSGGVLTVPDNSLAEVALERGTPEDPEEPAQPETRPVAHVRVFMEFDEKTSNGWWRQIHHDTTALGNIDPWGPAPLYLGDRTGTPNNTGDARQPFTVDALRIWAKDLLTANPGTQFIVIGHCCDIGTNNRNDILMGDRARAGAELLTEDVGNGTHISASLVHARGEDHSSPSLPSDPTGFSDVGRTLADRVDASSAVVPNPSAPSTGWRIKRYYFNGSSRPSGWGATDRNVPERQESRCVDIYAVLPVATPAPTTPSDDDSENASRRRTLVPGDDQTSSPDVDSAESNLNYRFEIRAKWDSPTWVDSNDSIPVLVQLTFDWTPTSMELPDPTSGLGGAGGSVTPADPTTGTSPDNYRIVARFTYDPRGGEAVFGLALDSPGDPNGLAKMTSTDAGGKTLATALALGPALLGGITSADAETAAVRLSALLIAVVAASVFDVVDEGTLILHKVEVEHKQRSLGELTGSRTRILFDYTVELRCSTELLGVNTSQPIKIKYKNVGIEFDDSKEDFLEKFNLVYEDANFEVVDPGKWEIDGWLGQLLGITAIRLGTGSVWFEVDMELAVDLGVVEVSSAKIRILIDESNVTVDLRGLAAKVDIPGVVKGAGALAVGDGGDVSASLDLTIIPADIRAYAGLVMKDGMTHLEAGVRFAAAIPLGGTGFGLFGFMGRFVSNGTRNLEGMSSTDPIQRELEWYARPIVGTPAKYRPLQGQYAIGLGVVVGTMPDAGFTFNAEGMLTFEFPDPSVVFTIDASLMSKASGEATEEGSTTDVDWSLSLLGIIAISSEGLGIGIRGEFKIPKVLIAKIPFAAWFPFQSGGTAGYLRVGSDGEGGRAGEPISVQVLPDILDMKAWSYFMIEEKQLLRLGGHDDWNFYGFSIGFGAGFGFKWGGSAIYLEISASFLAGLGTRPFTLQCGVFIKGELWLLIIGLGISAELVLKITEDDWELKGEICGKISFFFFTIKGCVGFELGSTAAFPPPPAEPLIQDVSLVDKFNRVVGKAVNEVDTTSLTDANTAWPDTTIVLHFAHTVETELDADSVQPNPSNGWGSDWGGTARLKYLYRLRKVELLDAAGNPVTLKNSDGVDISAPDWPSVWWMPAYRAAFPEDGEPPAGEHEGWDLGVLKWDPAPWARNLPEGGDGLSSDPSEVLPRACDDAPAATPHCVFGEDALRIDVETVDLLGPPSGGLPYPSNFKIRGRESYGSYGVELMSELASLFGLPFIPGAKVNLPQPWDHPAIDRDLVKAWRLPYIVRDGRVFASLGYNGTYHPQVVEPDIVLAICLDLPRSQVEREVCIDFAELQPGQALGESITIEGVVFRDRGHHLQTANELPVGAPDGSSELLFTSKGIEIILPVEATKVVVEAAWLETDDHLKMEIYDDNGVVLGEDPTNPGRDNVHAYTVEAPGIRIIRISGGQSTGLVQKLCYTATIEVDRNRWAEAIFNAMLGRKTGDDEPQPRFYPRVIGSREDDSTDAWAPTYVGEHYGKGHACLYLQYRPQEDVGPWTNVHVLPWPYMNVSIVSACATTVGAADSQAEDDDTREDMQDAVNDAVNGDQDDRLILLDANTTYRVRATYDWAVWQYTDDEPKPPDDLNWSSPPDSVTVHTGEEQTFRFRTAPGGAIADEELLTFDQQDTFEPRGILRYLHGFDPDKTRPFHLLNDLLWVHFDVEWVQTLLDRYGYDLELSVRRTDPPAQPEGAPPFDLAVSISWAWHNLPIAMHNVADQRLSLALIDAPCMDGPMPSGGSAGISADLDPRAEYDLILTAVNQSDDEDRIEVSKSHFKTSRYRNVDESITATGFNVTMRGGTGTGASANVLFPLDFVATAGAPSGVELASDAALDEALVAMGMDPWPLPNQPGVVLIWHLASGGWQLVAALVDGDESLSRPARREDPADLTTVNPPPRMEVLGLDVVGTNYTVRRSNGAGTRILLVPDSPPDLSSLDEFPVTLVINDREVTVEAQRFITSVPHIVSQEGS